jgi:hypothetical protein
LREYESTIVHETRTAKTDYQPLVGILAFLCLPSPDGYFIKSYVGRQNSHANPKREDHAEMAVYLEKFERTWSNNSQTDN